MSEHTPGPWVALPGDGKVLISSNLNSDGELIDETRPANNGGIYVAHVLGPDQQANARLIAAAPDMLEALRGIVPNGVSLGNATAPDYLVVPLDVSMGELRAVAKAIAAATGDV